MDINYIQDKMNPKKQCFGKKAVRLGSKGSGQKKIKAGGGVRGEALPRNTDPGVRVGNKGSGQKIKAGGGVQGGGRSASPRNAYQASTYAQVAVDINYIQDKMNPKKQCFGKKAVRLGSKGSGQKNKSGWGCRGEGAAPPPAMRTKQEVRTHKSRWILIIFKIR